ncbi:MAG: hypothetical protein EKK51_07705 [Mycolicibacterium sp.]|uniref:hypothetical protein n=1 Tax=Mycolicibacterium sp. TaxID=2320850 RepID=UPI000F98A75F|nr:hypothetical protein [Mycolicibacterium sp.]RUP32995.1 MAG: hypothetical protein EKK51_07705 [Mycolicibacterium sp.]
MPRTLSAAEIDELFATARQWRSRVLVRAMEVEHDTNWTTERGDILHANAGDWWVIDGDNRWSVAGSIFRETYQRIRGNQFRKTATVSAVPMSEAFTVRTLEGVASGGPGDWLVRNASGECWPVTGPEFERRYVQI